MRRVALSLIAGWMSLAIAAETAVLPGSALWLEQVPGTTDALVVGSWTWTIGIEECCWLGIQGWSYGICHAPQSARVGDCGGVSDDPCKSCPGEPLPEPFRACGCDTTGEGVNCISYPPCAAFRG